MQEDINKFVHSSSPVAIWIIIGWIGMMMVLGGIGARRAWRDGSTLMVFFFVLQVMGMGAIGIALLVAIFNK